MTYKTSTDPISIKDSLVALPFFDKCQASELDELTKRLELRKYAKGEFVFREGEPGTFMGFVLKGTLEVMKENTKGQLKSLVLIKKGFPFGEMALVDNYARSATIMAKEPCILLALSKDRLEELVEQHPEIAVKIWQGISRLLSLNLRRTSGALSEYLGR
jgi:CRP-like cAMP-binding protein